MDTTANTNALHQKFGIAGIAAVEAGKGGLPKVRITTEGAAAEIYLHGAQVTSWHPQGAEEVIFLSEKSHWQAGKAIRGGIPICFPWFRSKTDDPKAPSHGFARTTEWKLASIAQQDKNVIVDMELDQETDSQNWWPQPFRLVHRVTVGDALKLELLLTNTGTAPMRFEEALHTYFHVGDARRAQVAGLEGITYLDNVDSNRSKVQGGNVTFSGPLDNAYLATESMLDLIDPVLKRRIRTEKQRSHTTVVWNPWEEAARALSDLDDEEWTQFVCVEACNIREAAVTVAAGEEHSMTATISVLPE